MKRNKNGEIIFKDYPNFKPNLTPREIFLKGSFGGTYWRPIYSSITNKNYKNIHKKYPKSWWKGISEDKLSSSEYNKNINLYNVKVGTSLDMWETKKWITKYHPYGWIHWYCDFYMGKRCPDDERQIKRWEGIAGKEGRFRKWLLGLIYKKNTKYNDEKVSPKIRQTLLHWAYEPTKKDYNDYKKNK